MGREGTPRFEWQGRRIGVVLIDPLPVVREALGLLVETQPDFEIVALAGSADEGLERLARLRRRSGLVAMVSLRLPRPHDGPWCIRTLRERFTSLVVLASTAEDDRSSVAEAMAAGADGLIHKRSNPTAFLDGLRRAARGETVMAGVPATWLGWSPSQNLATILTDKETEVLQWAAEGLTARQIAVRLGMRERTATTHLSRIYRKLGVTHRFAAVRAAADRGILGERYAGETNGA